MPTIELTYEELDALKWLLVEEAQRQDDDGCEGTFAQSVLNAVYNKVNRSTKP